MRQGCDDEGGGDDKDQRVENAPRTSGCWDFFS